MISEPWLENHGHGHEHKNVKGRIWFRNSDHTRSMIRLTM